MQVSTKSSIRIAETRILSGMQNEDNAKHRKPKGDREEGV